LQFLDPPLLQLSAILFVPSTFFLLSFPHKWFSFFYLFWIVPSFLEVAIAGSARDLGASASATPPGFFPFYMAVGSDRLVPLRFTYVSILTQSFWSIKQSH